MERFSNRVNIISLKKNVIGFPFSCYPNKFISSTHCLQNISNMRFAFWKLA